MSDLSYVRNNDGTYSKLVQLSGSIPTGSNVIGKTDMNGVFASDSQIILNGSYYRSNVIDCKDFKNLTLAFNTSISIPQANKPVDVIWYQDAAGNGRVRNQNNAMQNTGDDTTLGGAVAVPVMARYAKLQFNNNSAAQSTFNYQYRLGY